VAKERTAGRKHDSPRTCVPPLRKSRLTPDPPSDIARESRSEAPAGPPVQLCHAGV